jgi:hypothetical protein
MYDYLNIRPTSKEDFRLLNERWNEARKAPSLQRNPNENGYERDERLLRIKKWDEAYDSWKNSFDYNSLS